MSEVQRNCVFILRAVGNVCPFHQGIMRSSLMLCKVHCCMGNRLEGPEGKQGTGGRRRHPEGRRGWFGNDGGSRAGENVLVAGCTGWVG